MLHRFKTVENSVEKVENGLNKGFSLKRFVEKYRKEQFSEIKKPPNCETSTDKKSVKAS